MRLWEMSESPGIVKRHRTLTMTQEVLVCDIPGRFGFIVIEDGGRPNFPEYCGDFGERR